MKHSFRLSALTFISSLSMLLSYSQKVDCSKPNNVVATNQKIREKTYQYVKLATDKNRKVNEDSLLALTRDYIEIQTSFNAVFTSMKEDKANFASKKLICNRYSDTLAALIQQAT